MVVGLDRVVVLTRRYPGGAAQLSDAVCSAPAWQNSGDGASTCCSRWTSCRWSGWPRLWDADADRISGVLAAQGEGLASLCFRTNDVAKLHRRLDRLTLKPEPVTDVESRAALGGAALSWKRTRAATGCSARRPVVLHRRAASVHSLRLSATGAITAMDMW